MSTTISFDRAGPRVVAVVRQYDGIERPDLTRFEMSADEALGHAGQLQILGAAARDELARLKAEQVENKRQKLAALRGEVAALEHEIATATNESTNQQEAYNG